MCLAYTDTVSTTIFQVNDGYLVASVTVLVLLITICIFVSAVRLRRWRHRRGYCQAPLPVQETNLKACTCLILTLVTWHIRRVESRLYVLSHWDELINQRYSVRIIDRYALQTFNARVKADRSQLRATHRIKTKNQMVKKTTTTKT